MQGVNINVTDDIEKGLISVKQNLALYIGGRGAKSKNFHTDLMARMGVEAEAHQIQDLFLEGRRNEAIAAVPSQFADEISLVGPIERVRDRLDAWRDSPITSLMVSAGSREQLQQVAELVLD